MRLDPGSARGHNGRGVVAKCQQRFDDVLAEFELAMQLAPDFAKPYLNRSTIIISSVANRTDSSTTLNRAIALDPSLVLSYRLRGRCLYELKRYTEAIADLTQWLADHPDECG